MQRWKYLVLASGLSFCVTMTAGAVNFGIGIGFGHHHGVSGGIYTDIPSERDRYDTRYPQFEKSFTILQQAGLQGERVGRNAYEVTLKTEPQKLVPCLLTALEQAGYTAVTVTTMGDENNPFWMIEYHDPQAESLWREHPDLALTIPQRLLVYRSQDKTRLLLPNTEALAYDQRNGKVTAATEVQTRLLETIVLTLS
ncbi:MAG: hypothetical protein E6102_03950 [Negativicoccus succinicivorans]|uniref:hypothetical protein n=2 Tax=Negativicoccus succinicivorans TaxID=620903 RepID=UPI00290E8D97|nr:hypothetical protein [Negativicoccus succinicivorans]MDU5395898.1 hypothetical protein [Negativicoccus succinicivorans]